jgi:uncharacterized protein YbjQ (UPF0145 family)
LFCPNCGKQVQDDAAFCPYCRTSLKAAPSQTQTSVPQVLILTSPYAPGYKIDKVIGTAYGITVRSRGLGGNIIAGIRTIGGGEINEYTEMAHQARQQALDRLAQNAAGMGANGVISVMFDSNEIGNTMAEIIAFGTAVVLSPMAPEQAQQSYVKLS